MRTPVITNRVTIYFQEPRVRQLQPRFTVALSQSRDLIIYYYTNDMRQQMEHGTGQEREREREGQGQGQGQGADDSLSYCTTCAS